MARKAQYDIIGTRIIDTYSNNRIVASCTDLKITRKIKKLLNEDSLMKYSMRMSQTDKSYKKTDQ